MNVYIIKSLKWSGEPSYYFQDVYFQADANGYTVDINKAGLFSESEVKEKSHYYNNGFDTEAILVESTLLPDDEFKTKSKDLKSNQQLLEEQLKRFEDMKRGLRDLEIEMNKTESIIAIQKQELRIQEAMKK